MSWASFVSERVIGVLGARSIVGECLLKRLQGAGNRVAAFTRQTVSRDDRGISWYRIERPPTGLEIEYWICLAPIWVVPGYFPFLEQCGARRIIAFSSTSRFSKTDSTDSREQADARRLVEAEARFSAWAEKRGVDWCVLRPTLIYGLGRDHNVSELIRIIRRYRFFPLLGRAMGLRQPVHADDLAQACIAALEYPAPLCRSYNLSGGETLPYREMIDRIFHSLGQRSRFISLPLPLFRLALSLLQLLPRYRYWSGAMVERMNRDLVFDHGEATRDLGFKPRCFELGRGDLPSE